MTAPFLYRGNAIEQPPLIAHVIHHLVMGGLENGLINLINRISRDRYRHAIVCMDGFSDFSLRLRRDDVQIFDMQKKAGHDFGLYVRLYKLFRRIRPALIQGRNLAALDSLLPAALAGVPRKIHGEHGRDVADLDGANRRHRWLRRLHSPMVDHYIALSKDLERYLRDGIGISQDSITQIYNGVDTELFHPARSGREPLPCLGFAPADAFVIGTIGRMQVVKDQLTLARAFVLLLQMNPQVARILRLVMVGDGPLREQVADILETGGVRQFAWLAGKRDEVPQLMRGLDLFVLPSLAEGISNTILEAMASGLPVVATAVGGNPELVDEGRTGRLVPSADPHAMAAVIGDYVANRGLGRQHGSAARGCRRAPLQHDRHGR